MKYNITIFLFFLTSLGYSQIGGEDEVYLNGDFIDATFQGGNINKFYDFIIKNFDLNTIEKKVKLYFLLM